MRFLVILALLLPLPAMAQGWIDYERVLADNAAKVVTETAANGAMLRSIDFGNGVTVVCEGPEGGAKCFGTDNSPAGAVGCALMIAAELQAKIRNCTALGTPEQRSAMEALYNKVGQFVATNAVPSRNWIEMRAELDTGLDIAQSADQCTADTNPAGDVIGMLNALTTPDAGLMIDQGLATPRLPVSDPCL